MHGRIVELESKVAILEHTVDALSGELAAHQRMLDRLRAELDAVMVQVRRSRGEGPIEPHDTPPPHWGGGS